MGEPTNPLPVTLVGGFLGAGKTTLVNHLLRHSGGRRIGVVVNDFGSINIDADLIVGVDDQVMRLSNGCICCSMRSGVIDTMMRLSERSDDLDHVLVEASGASDPGALVEAFRELQGLGAIRFDGLVTVVDADQVRFGDDEVGRLMRRQVQGADLVIVNKIDLVSEPSRVKEAIRDVEPEARLVESTFGRVPLDVLLGLPPRAVRARGPAEHPDFRTFTWVHAAPVAFKPMFDGILSFPPSVLRAKGFLNLAERPQQKVVAHLVGRRLYAQPIGTWDGETPESRLVVIGTFDEAEQASLTAHLESAARQAG